MIDKNGWMPIETIPAGRAGHDDCPTVLVWVENGKSRLFNAEECIRFGHAFNRASGGKQVQAHGCTGNWNITHWQPLPGAPDEWIDPCKAPPGSKVTYEF